MKTRYELNFYPFYNVTGMKLHLEEMARRGWFLDRISTFTWRYHQAEPKDLHYAVSYYARASMFDPEPSEGQQTFQDFCAHSGWTLAAEDAKLQIFRNETADPVPIYTDPESEIEAIRAVSRQQLVVYWLMLAILTLQLLFQLPDLFRAPIDALSNGLQLSITPALVLVVLFYLLDLVHYFRWRKQALAAAETGDFVPTAKSSRLWLPWVLLAAVLLMAFGVLSSGVPGMVRFFLFYVLAIIALILAVNGVRNLLRRKKVAADTNRAVTIVVDLVLAGLLTFALTFDAFHILDHGQAPRNELLLSMADLGGPAPEDGQWDTSVQASPFLARYRGWQYPREGNSLSYTLVDVYCPSLLAPCLDQLLHSRDGHGSYQENYDPDRPFYRYQPLDPVGQGEAQLWQLWAYDQPSSSYIFQYDSRLVSLDFGEEPTPAQLGRAVKVLAPIF